MAKKVKRINNGFGIASLVLAILSALTLVLFPISFILSLLAVLLSNKQDKISPSGLAIAGRIIGIVVLAISSIFVLIFLIGIIWAFLQPIFS